MTEPRASYDMALASARMECRCVLGHHNELVEPLHLLACLLCGASVCVCQGSLFCVLCRQSMFATKDEAPA